MSWRFRPLADAWPLVMITSPADRRLSTALSPSPRVLHAVVFGPDRPNAVTASIDGGAPFPLRDEGRFWAADLPPIADGAHRITVRAETGSGTGEDTIELGEPFRADAPRDGSDAHRIPAWPERHLLGTQL